jgi:hypothetical protein
MTAITVLNPFPTFKDVDGDPLDDGYIYIGTTGLNPESNPVTVYWDDDATIPAAQPIRTINGFPSQNGAAGTIFSKEIGYSITVRNKNGTLVYSKLVDDIARVGDSGIVFDSVANLKAETDIGGNSVNLLANMGKLVRWTSYYAGFNATTQGPHGGGVGVIVPLATGTEDDCEFFDCATAQVRQIFEHQINVSQAGVKLDGVTNDGPGAQQALYAAERNNIGMVVCDEGTLLLGDVVTPTALYTPVGVSFSGASMFGTAISKSGLGTGWHLINGKPDNTEGYFDPLGNALAGTGDPITARNNVIKNFTVENGLGLWAVKSRETSFENINAGTGATTAIAFGNDATEPCRDVTAKNIHRNTSQSILAWYTVGVYNTTGFRISDVFVDALSNSSAIQIDNCTRGVVDGYYINQQDRTFNGVTTSGSTYIHVKNGVAENCLSHFVSFANAAPFSSYNTFENLTSIGCVNHARIYTRDNNIINTNNTGNTGSINDVVLETDALNNTFTNNQFIKKTLSDTAVIINNQNWFGNVGLEEGYRYNVTTSAVEYWGGVGDMDWNCRGVSYFGINATVRNYAMDNTTFTSIGNDGVPNLGQAGNRWGTVYAAVGTINTSDERDKTELLELSEVEKLVALELKQSIRKYKFTDAVDKKGDAARIHVGIGAQTAIDIFASHGLDAFDYSMICWDEWDDLYNKEGDKLLTKAGNRYGVRYDELLAFIIAAI